MDPGLSNVIIIAVMAVILFFAVKGAIPHFKGEGSCCGGGSRTKLIKPKKLDHVTAHKRIKIEGMVCDNCSARVQNALNSIEGINAKVVRSRGEAYLKLGKELDDEAITKVITDLGYKVTDIK